MLIQLNSLKKIIASSHSSIYDICFLNNIIKSEKKMLLYIYKYLFKNIDFFSKNIVKVV